MAAETKKQKLARTARRFFTCLMDRGALTKLANNLMRDEDTAVLARRFLDAGTRGIAGLVAEYVRAAKAEMVAEVVEKVAEVAVPDPIPVAEEPPQTAQETPAPAIEESPAPTVPDAAELKQEVPAGDSEVPVEEPAPVVEPAPAEPTPAPVAPIKPTFKKKHR